MNCRPQCGACCIAPSINHALPGMPGGKPAGVACVNLDAATRRCGIWGTAAYPETCRRFAAADWVCGDSRDEAIRLLGALELATR